eukprot:Hpha_TRINITY_DN16385_c3_g2::TRINITY_DN16385_c3_g2_i1::g.58216::m.58216
MPILPLGVPPLQVQGQREPVREQFPPYRESENARLPRPRMPVPVSAGKLAANFPDFICAQDPLLFCCQEIRKVTRKGGLRTRVMIITAEALFVCTPKGRVSRLARLSELVSVYWRRTPHLQFALNYKDSEPPIAWEPTKADSEESAWQPLVLLNSCRAPIMGGESLPLRLLRSTQPLEQVLGLAQYPSFSRNPAAKLYAWTSSPGRERSPSPRRSKTRKRTLSAVGLSPPQHSH